jgi:hypothetical protein
MHLFDSLLAVTLLGGLLIGAALGGLTLLTGRIMSGTRMIGSLLGGAEGVAATSITFLGGLVAAPFLLNALEIAKYDVTETGWPLLVVGGLLLGISGRLVGASLGTVITGITRRAPHSMVLLIVMLAGATIGGILQSVFVGVGFP